MLPIQKKHIAYNFSNSGESKKYIVIHDTGNTGRGADDISHYKYFNGGVRNASAHFFVDCDSITETVDPNLVSWHCGDGYGQYGITNSNSIGIEICINSDGNYAQAVANAIELTKYLMKQFGIPASNVKRHWDASHKACPNTMMANNWAKWNEFKSQLTGSVSKPTPAPSTSTSSPVIGMGTVTANTLNVRESANTSATVLGTLNKGERVKIGSIVNNWVNIYYGEHGGWVYAPYVSVDAKPSAPAPTPKPIPKVEYAVVATDVLNVRSGAGTSFSVVGQLTRGQKIKLDCKIGDWWSTYYGEHGGFVHASYINLI